MNASDLMAMEGAIVGSLMRSRVRLDDLPHGFTPETLQNEPWRKILAAILKLSREVPITDEPFDSALVAMEARLNDLERETLLRADGLVASGELQAQAKRLLEARRVDRMERMLLGATEALRNGRPSSEVASKLSALLVGDDLAPPMGSYWTDDFKAIVALNETAAASKAGRLRTGIAAIDALLRILPGNVIVIAAAEKHGKTRLVRQIARNVASQGRFVLMHSLEMTTLENVALDLADCLNSEAERFFGEGKLTKDEWTRLGPVLDRLAGDPEGKGYIITNSQYGSLDAICLATERFHRKHNLGLVVVDYLQLVEAEAGKGASRENQVSMVSRRMKRLAANLNVPIIALAQFNKEYSKRGGKEDEPQPRPRASDLRESGAIAQDANAVCFVHNPMMNHPDDEVRSRGPWEFIVDRVRFGKPGVCELWPELKHARFRERRPEAPPPVRHTYQPEESDE